MNYSLQIKSVGASFLYATGLIAREIGRRANRSSVILTYHRILPREEAQWIQAGMYVEPGTFERHLNFLRDHFTLVSLEEFLCQREAGQRGSDGRPLCALTFDDGWRDFREHAFPLLKAYGAPATVFLPTDFIGTGRWFWTDRLSFCFTRRAGGDRPVVKAGISGSPIVNRLNDLGGPVASRIESAVEILKGYRDEAIEEILAELKGRWKLDDPFPPGRVFLNWEEVGEMSRSGVVSYGSHTAGHRILTTLDREEVIEEMRCSREKLIREGIVDPSFLPLSYPNGNHDPEIAGLAKSAGFRLAVTTRSGWNGFHEDPFLLRRNSVHQDISRTEAMLGCRIVNLF